jgi:hypothetical protein
MRARSVLTAAVVATAILATGCGVTTNTSSPACAAVRAETLYLVTQAVPSAQRIPCVTAYPGGWNLGSVDVHDGEASFTLNSDRGGSGALKVTLRESCDVAGAIEVPSDKPGTVRFDQMPVVDRGFRGVRSYRFEGGCATFRFDIESKRAGALVDEASLAVGFVTRADVSARMDEMERS